MSSRKSGRQVLANRDNQTNRVPFASDKQSRKSLQSEMDDRSTPSQKRPHKTSDRQEHDASNVSGKRARIDRSANSQSLERPSAIDRSLSKRSGKVLRIVLTNFMCHSKLVIDFNPQVNLLLGSNGSGKSAVLSALVIGMGCKASATNRGTNITQLIKRGENCAIVEVQLANYQHDGYHYSTYGDRIILERAIFASGRSTYKLKTASGSLVTAKRDDLLRMAMFLNIQVDNPVCVLNQDVSRSFLRDNKPEKFYQLYMKATQIEGIMDKLNDCMQHARSAKIELRSMSDQAESLRKQVGDLTERVNMLMSVESLKAQTKQWRAQREWQLVVTQERMTDEIRQTFAKFDAEYRQMVEKYNDTAVQTRFRDELRDFERALGDLQDSIATKRKQLASKRAHLESIEAVSAGSERTLRSLESRRKRHDDDLQQLRTDIADRMSQDESGTAKSNAQIEREKNEQTIREVEARLDETGAMLDNAHRDADMLANTRQQELEQQRELDFKRQRLSEQSNALQRDLDGYQKSGNNALAVYGAQMPSLVNEIEAAFRRKEFREMPIGPIGQYVQVAEDMWKPVAENAIGSVISAFLVSCAADRKALDALITRRMPEFRQLTIISMSFNEPPYNIEPHSVRACNGARRLIDVISVTHPVVLQCLLDQCKIERVLLTENTATAIALTKHQDNVPVNMSHVVLVNPFTMFYPEPNYRSYSIKTRGSRYLQLNVEEKCATLKQDLRRLAEQRKSMEAAKVEQDQRLKAIVLKMRQNDKRQNELELAKRNLMERVKELKLNEYPEEDDEYWINELRSLEKTIAEINENMRIEQEKSAEKSAEYKRLADELKDCKAEVVKQEQEMSNVQRQLADAKWNFQNAHAHAQSGKAKSEAMGKELEKLRAEMLAAETKLDRLEKRASKFGERVETNLTDDELETAIHKHEQRIAMLEKASEPLDKMQQRLNEGNRQLKIIDEKVQSLTDALINLRAARNQRFNALSHYKQTVVMRVQHRFNLLMKLRKYKGKITFDDEARTLSMSVIPRDAHIDDAVSNTKSLSGGERSYSTIALLLSLWSCVNFPFYFLDEYDVFTDTVNRHYINKLLLDEAKKKPARQYTFLTPQDMSDIQSSDDLTIHSMAPPER